ncbi:MAG: DNA-binding transcriptional regulator [Kiritimatiellae bacterium]|nr:DNA-binding transcriptional regulator [Kiritimatiellia bacterium]
MKKIALTVERSRAYGRRFCEGVAEYAQTKGDWSLEFVPDVKGGATHYDGFIFRVLDEDSARRLRSLHKPVVDVFFRQNSGFGVADADNAAISRLAVSHFLTRKFVNFGFCGYDGIRYSDARRDEFVRELAKSGYPCSVYRTPHRILANFTRDVILNECVEEIPDEAELEKWLRGLTLPCAVFCCHDLRSYQLSKICRKIGLRVPEDVAILGVDDDTLLCSFSTPMLSSIDPDAFGIGYEAARILDRMMTSSTAAAHPPASFLPPKGVVTRASSEIYPVDPPWISKALVFIRKNVRDRLSASDVFAHLGLSHAVVEKAFKATLGTTVQREIMRSRLEEALHLLIATQEPVVRVASLAGFASAQYFCRNFTSAYGMSPQQYREKKCSKTSRKTSTAQTSD